MNAAQKIQPIGPKSNEIESKRVKDSSVCTSVNETMRIANPNATISNPAILFSCLNQVPSVSYFYPVIKKSNETRSENSKHDEEPRSGVNSIVKIRNYIGKAPNTTAKPPIVGVLLCLMTSLAIFSNRLTYPLKESHLIKYLVPKGDRRRIENKKEGESLSSCLQCFFGDFDVLKKKKMFHLLLDRLHNLYPRELHLLRICRFNSLIDSFSLSGLT